MCDELLGMAREGERMRKMVGPSCDVSLESETNLAAQGKWSEVSGYAPRKRCYHGEGISTLPLFKGSLTISANPDSTQQLKNWNGFSYPKKEKASKTPECGTQSTTTLPAVRGHLQAQAEERGRLGKQ